MTVLDPVGDVDQQIERPEFGGGAQVHLGTQLVMVGFDRFPTRPVSEAAFGGDHPVVDLDEERADETRNG